MTDQTPPEDGDRRFLISYQYDLWGPPGRLTTGAAMTIPKSLDLAVETWWQIAENPRPGWMPYEATRLTMPALQIQRFRAASTSSRNKDGRWVDEHGGTYDRARFRQTAHWRDHVVFDLTDPRDGDDNPFAGHAATAKAARAAVTRLADAIAAGTGRPPGPGEVACPTCGAKPRPYDVIVTPGPGPLTATGDCRNGHTIDLRR